MSIASIQMYTNFPPLQQATEDLWAFLRDRLRADGLDEVPDTLDRNLSYDQAWLDPNLILSQTCGYPYVLKLRGHVRLVATPEYGYHGCYGPNMRSFVIVREDSAFESLWDLRGLCVAINQAESNSGYNLLRALIAPYARGAQFFSSVLHTGSHDASLSAVKSGHADVAAIDCITFGNIGRFDPEKVEGIKILTETSLGPGLPFITRLEASDGEVNLLRNALFAAIASPSLNEIRNVLSLRNFHVLGDADYERLASLKDHAARLGYSEIS